MTDVKVTYDETVDAAYVYLTAPQAHVTSARMYPCDPVDGIEVLAASSRNGLSAAANLMTWGVPRAR
ncbi:DUF2283 domain-containing protein [Streptomyces griseorubiginosus]|nr:DUF2283 domain-containing protein [Streptomyces griseorubiginosus]WUB50564.1 DUF2283 domain-containing protein [Streptomyces griseorubiginosus]